MEKLNKMNKAALIKLVVEMRASAEAGETLRNAMDADLTAVRNDYDKLKNSYHNLEDRYNTVDDLRTKHSLELIILQRSWLFRYFGWLIK